MNSLEIIVDKDHNMLYTTNLILVKSNITTFEINFTQKIGFY